jgi:peptide/nickel transport system ATP-binding protein
LISTKGRWSPSSGKRKRQDDAGPDGAGASHPNQRHDLFPRKTKGHFLRRKKNGVLEEHPGDLQDPFSTFNIFKRVDTVLADCVKLRSGKKVPREQMTDEMRQSCQFVNLPYDEISNKYPFELSGGQMQRLMIARIFLMQPKILIADEPTSMIDAWSRATILDMLMALRDRTKMTIVFITHDIGLAYYVSDTVYIMERGKFVEHGVPVQGYPPSPGQLHQTVDQRCSQNL